MMIRLARVAVGPLIVVLALLMPGRALGHAALVETSPADGAQLEEAPQTLRLGFTEPVRPTALGLRGPDGMEVALTATSGGQANEVVAALPPLGRGVFYVSWRVLSLDGHPIGGTVVFGVGTAAGGVLTPDSEDRLWTVVFGTTKALLYGATLAAAGGAFFLLLMRGATSPTTRRRTMAWASAAALLSIVACMIETMVLTGGHPSVHALLVLTAGSPGASAGLRLAGLAILAAGIALWPGRPWIAALGGAVATLSFAATGHALAAEPSRAVQALVAVHVTVAAFWIGALGPLLEVARRHRAVEVAPVMARFSAAATLAVPVLLTAGLILAWRLVGDLGALVGTAYGLALLAKVALVAGMLALAAANKWRFVPALARGDEATRLRLRRSIGMEIVAAAAILAATATLTAFGAPGLERDEPYRIEATEGDLTVELSVDPARPGTNRVDVRLHGPDGAARDVLEATLVLRSDGLGVAAIERSLDRTGPGHYRMAGPELSLPGEWQATVELLVNDFEKRDVTVPIVIGSPAH